MARTRIRQKTQLSNSDTYEDNIDFAGSAPSSDVLEQDLNDIRTQLQKLTEATGVENADWYDTPKLPVKAHVDMTSPVVLAGQPIDVGLNYSPGNPYDLQVFLNGDLLFPSEVVDGALVGDSNDYQEVDNDENLVPVLAGTDGRKIILNFDLEQGDILQFKFRD